MAGVGFDVDVSCVWESDGEKGSRKEAGLKGAVVEIMR